MNFADKIRVVYDTTQMNKIEKHYNEILEWLPKVAYEDAVPFFYGVYHLDVDSKKILKEKLEKDGFVVFSTNDGRIGINFPSKPKIEERQPINGGYDAGWLPADDVHSNTLPIDRPNKSVIRDARLLEFEANVEKYYNNVIDFIRKTSKSHIVSFNADEDMPGVDEYMANKIIDAVKLRLTKNGYVVDPISNKKFDVWKKGTLSLQVAIISILVPSIIGIGLFSLYMLGCFK